MSDESGFRGRDQNNREEVRKARRKRINRAFRDDDLELCLREIAAGLKDEPEDANLLKARELIQKRYFDERVRVSCEEGKYADAARAARILDEYGALDGELSRAVQNVLSDIEKGLLREIKPPEPQSTPPPERKPEEELDVSEEVLRKAEIAWSAGKRRETKQLLRELGRLPLDDHDLILRREGLRRLVEYEETETRTERRRHSSTWRWVMALVLILSVAGAVFMVFQRRNVGVAGTDSIGVEPNTSSESVTAMDFDVGWVVFETVPAAGAVEDTAGLTVGSTGEAIVVPEGDVTFRVSAEGFADTVLGLSIAVEETAVVEVHLRELSPTAGSLSVISNPEGAAVLLEGAEKVGVTPLHGVVVPSGKHMLLVTSEGRVPMWRSIEIRPGSLTTVEAELSRWHDEGRFQLNANPWAFVFVNEESVGTTPLTTEALPTAVNHDILFRSPDGIEIRKQLKLDPARGSPTSVMVDFPKPGIVAIATRESLTRRTVWAEVWSGGRYLGESPGEFGAMPGAISLRIERAGYFTIDTTIVVVSEKRVTLTLNLVPLGHEAPY